MRNLKRVLALVCAVLFCMALAAMPGAMVAVLAATPLLALALNAGQVVQFDCTWLDDQRAQRRKLAHDASREYRHRWAASADVAGKLGSTSSTVHETGRLAARSDEKKNRVYNARDQSATLAGSLFHMSNRRCNLTRDRPVMAMDRPMVAALS